MRRFNLSSKLEKISEWLEKMRNRRFITKVEYLRKNQQFVLGLSQQNHKLSEEVKKVIEQIHIMIRKSTKSNPSLQ
jgi:CTP:phosphocholine cytidylyltransferase-like protein